MSRLLVLTVPQSNRVLRELARRSTLGQMRAVHARNTQALELVRADKTGSVDVCCPHCCRGFPCEDCLWTSVTDSCVPNLIVPLGCDRFTCCAVKFNGVAFNEICADGIIELQHHCINVGQAYCQRRDPSLAEKHRQRAIQFLQGHIDWTLQPWWTAKGRHM